MGLTMAELKDKPLLFWAADFSMPSCHPVAPMAWAVCPPWGSPLNALACARCSWDGLPSPGWVTRGLPGGMVITAQKVPQAGTTRLPNVAICSGAFTRICRGCGGARGRGAGSSAAGRAGGGEGTGRAGSTRRVHLGE